MLTPTGRERLAEVLRNSSQLVSVDTTARVLRIDSATAAKLLARWRQQGWLRRVRRGLYAPAPLTAAPNDQVVEDPWILVPILYSPGYVGGASAAQHWDLTEQLFRSVFVFTARSSKRTNASVYGTAFVVHHISERLIFGTRPVWRGQTKIQVSDVHRTVVDMLDFPATGGGIRHVADCLGTYFSRPDAKSSTLIEYADRIGNGAVFKRLGFLVERMKGPKEIIEACLERLTKGVAKLDPNLAANRTVRRWRLAVPETWSIAGEQG